MMNKRHYLVMLGLAVVAGIIGGAVAKQLSRGDRLVLVQQAAQPAENIRSERFELTDKTGIRRALLELESNGEPALNLYDREGNIRVALSLRPDGGPNLLLWDGWTPIPRVGLAVLPNGSPSVELADQGGNLRMVLGLGLDGEPIVGFLDGDGHLQAAFEGETSKRPTS